MPIAFPLDFIDSWKFKKIVALHGRRLADCCTLTLLAMYKYCLDAAPTGRMTVRMARRLAHACNPRDKRRVLWALRQANILRCTPTHYSILALAPLPDRPAREQPRAQMNLALEQPLPAQEQPPAAEQVWADVEKVEQNQASDLARAVAYSSTQGDDAPPIDPAPSCTEFLQATDSERSDAEVYQEAKATGALAPCLLPLRAPAKKQRERQRPTSLGVAGYRPNAPEALGSAGRHPASQRQSGLESIGHLFSTVLEDLVREGDDVAGTSTVESDEASPSRIIEGPELTHPVNTQRVKKQQKLVLCREPSSDAANPKPAEMPPVPTQRPTYPTIADVKKESAKVWPCNPLNGRQAEHIVQRQTTWDELRDALKIIERDIARGDYKGPPVLIHVLGDVRKTRGLKPAVHAPRDSSERKALHDAINAELGDALYVHWCESEPYLDAMMGHSVDEILSLYTEVCQAPQGEDDRGRWKMTAAAFAAGKSAGRLGQRPPPNDERHVAQMLDAVWKKLGGRDVQLPAKAVDKTAQAG